MGKVQRITVAATDEEHELLRWYAALVGQRMGPLLRLAGLEELVDRAKALKSRKVSTLTRQQRRELLAREIVEVGL